MLHYRRARLSSFVSPGGPPFGSLLVVVFCFCLAGLAPNSFASQDTNQATRVTEKIVLPPAVPDPLETFNRGIWAFNRGLALGVVKPTARVYRAVVIPPFRNGIRNFGQNITFPGRLFNNLLQGKWKGARDETYRFAANSTVGFAGLVDIATKWKIPKSDADFGQTFGQWGWVPHFYLMLPIFGPSNDRDAIGLGADTAANPLTYITPYPFDPANPLTYFSPYTYCEIGITYNDLSDSVDSLARFVKAEMDAYSELQYAWTFVRQNRVADFHVHGEPDPASLETLQSIFFSYKDPQFPNQAKTRSVKLSTTGRRLSFTYWLQPQTAPIVYIVPGLGSHRLAEAALALAELAYQHGFSAVCVSSTFNYEFIQHAATASVPAYTPVDAHDLHVALTQIDQSLRKAYPERLGGTALLGYSMGAFQALYLAATESTNSEALLKFNRYVAINAPVRLLYGISKLDEFYQAPLAWAETERTADIENTFLKVAAMTKNSLTPQTSLPFNAVESKFLIGLAFRLILRDAIYSSQRRDNLGVLQHPVFTHKRQNVYKEILQYSYRDYLEKFLIPYYWMRGTDLTAPDALEEASDLRTYAAGLQANRNIRLILNRNDFLLPAEDLQWLQTKLPSQEITVFQEGGHLGNLANPAVQKAILRGLEGLATDSGRSP
jgi:ABC-type transporter lipoprotein component MlaA/pimeloyl-ACP methyl ester carboxylesterase